jgi:3'-5' exonuclease
MIKDLQIGSIFRGTSFAVTNLKDKTTTTGKPYKALILSDSSGTINGKIWSDNFSTCQIGEGTTIEADGRVGEWPKGVPEITITKCETTGQLDPDTDLYQSKTLIFDIETVGTEFNRLGEWEQDYLLNNLEKKTDDQDEAKNKTGLWSLFGFVSTVGCYDTKSQEGRVFHLCDTGTVTTSASNFNVYASQDEAELLTSFWEYATGFEKFVTFNGRGFDFPFLYLRSLSNRVKVPSKLINIDRSLHADLYELLKQGGHGFKLEALTRFLGLDNPKEQGISGLHVAKLYQEGKHQDIVDYVSRDALATKALYELIKKYLS